MKKSFIFIFVFFFILFLEVPSFADVDTSNLNITSGACYLVQPDTGRVIFEKNSKEKMYPASTTKIMTALLALENCKLDDIVTVSKSAVDSISADYATVYLNVGEQLTVEQLLNILLIPSGNIVGNIFAEHISGSVQGFVSLMNSRAKELGCVNSNYTNTYGLHDENHYSCAYDLYIIAKEAMKYDTFRNIVKQTSYKLAPSNVYSKDDRTLYTTNDLIKPNSKNYYYANAIGIKTGYTSQAKDCLVSAASKGGLEYYCVVLGAGKASNGLAQRYLETKKLFDFAYNNYQIKTLQNENSIFKTIEVKNATNDTKNLDLVVKDQINALVGNNNLNTPFIPTVSINDNLEAPISAGDVVGNISYTIDSVTYSSDLIAKSDVKKSYLFLILIAVGALVFIILICIIIFSFKNRKNKGNKYTTYSL